MEKNGAAPQVPEGAKTLRVYFDPATDDVGVVFDSKEFKTWDFVLAVLEMAKHKAQKTRELLEAQAIRSMMSQAQHAEQIRRQIMQSG